MTPDQLDTLRESHADLHRRVSILQSQVDDVSNKLDTNTQLTVGMAQTVNLIRDYQTAGRIGGKALVWVGGIAGGMVGIWHLLMLLIKEWHK